MVEEMERNPSAGAAVPESDLAEGRKSLARRLDDLRGLGLLPSWSETLHVEGEDSLQRLALSLADLLESAQRRVIETSIQLLSLRELIAGVLNMHTPEEVAKTVALYLHKAFDHERVLVGVYEPDEDALEGWVAVRRGSPRFSSFTVRGSWTGALRDALGGEEPIRSWQDTTLTPLIDGDHVPDSLEAFSPASVGPFIVYPLVGSQERTRAMGVLAVARGVGSPTMDGMDADILHSLVESVATAMENVILDEDVRREEAFRKDIMGSMAAGLVAVDLQCRVLTVNDRARKLTGFALDDLKGSVPDVLEADGDGIYTLLRETVHLGVGIPRREVALRRADGTRFPAACATTLLRNPSGEVYGAIVNIEDLSEIKAMEARIRQLDRLAALGRFTAGVAHEIRNPLAGIGAGVQYLARHLEGLPDQEENLAFIQTEIQRLNRIVEDLFQVTHPQPPRKTPERPRRLVELALRCLGPAPEDHRVVVHPEVPGNLPEVPVDPDQIQQVLINLIKNALEAAPPGGNVRVGGAVETDRGRRVLAMRVEDSGPGIDPEALPHIFEPFFTKGKANGTGLGLYVSHGIAERHGGELLAANVPGGGAVFTLKLPLNGHDTTETIG